MKKLVATLLLMLITQPALSQNLPEYVSTLVNDYANLIPAEQETQLRQQLGKLRDETGVEMVVLTIASRAEYEHGGDLQSFSTDLFNAWGIGDAERNDGVLVMIVQRDREMRLELGSGYDPAYDRVARSVVSDDFLPEFRNDNYPGGILSGVSATIDRIAKPHQRGEIPDGMEPEQSPKGWFAKYWFLIIGAAIAALIKFRKSLPSFGKCPNCGKHKVVNKRETLVPATKVTTGEGRKFQTCRNCDYHNDSTYTISRRSSNSSRSGGSSGSRGSFGGGSSSGGGSSGRW